MVIVILLNSLVENETTLLRTANELYFDNPNLTMSTLYCVTNPSSHHNS